MFMIVGILLHIYTDVSAGFNNTNNTSYVLATVLFYKDAKGQIMLATGPVPKTADDAIRKDVFSRINSADVKVVPIFQKPSAIPKSIDVLDFINDEYKTVFVTEVPKRLSRNLVVDLWNNLWGISIHKKKRRPKGRLNKTSTTDYETTTPTQTVGGEGTPTESLEDSSGPKNDSSIHDEVQEVKKESNENKDENISSESGAPKVLQSYEDFVPNDIYYNIEKRCVNWSDGCSQQSGKILDMSNKYFHYVYKRPRIVQWGPTID